MPKSVKVSAYMTRRPLVFHTNTDLLTASQQLMSHGLVCAPVLDEVGELCGVLSEIDCLKALLPAAYYGELRGISVAEIMTAVPETIDAEASVIEVADQFLHGQRHWLPVVEGGVLVGVLARRDVLRAVAEFVKSR